MTMGFQSGDVFHHEGREEHEERISSSSFMVFVLFVVDFFVG